MPANIEIKARIDSVDILLPRAMALADDDDHPQRIHQDDTFFVAPHGRLKLRVFADGAAELIHYDRPDIAGPKRSDYLITPVADADSLRDVLERACGLRGRVIKQRTLVMVGQTRIHLDRVQGLGDFLELEVVLQPGQSEAEGEAIARDVLTALGVADSSLIQGAYLDLLRATQPG
jgi:predicted adenylyl cyclase CyaB